MGIILPIAMFAMSWALLKTSKMMIVMSLQSLHTKKMLKIKK